MEQNKIIEFFNEYLTIDTIGSNPGKSTYSELFDFLLKLDIEIGDVLLPFNNPDALDCLKYANDELNPHNCFLNFCINTYEWANYEESLNGKKVKPPTLNEQIRESAIYLVKVYENLDNATTELDKDSARLMIDHYAGLIRDAQELMNYDSYIHHGLAKVLKHFGDWNANLKYGGEDAIPWKVVFDKEQEEENKRVN